MKDKKIVVLYNEPDWDLKIPFAEGVQKKCYEEWHEWGEKNDIEMYRAAVEWFDEKTMSFKKSWAYRNGTWIKVTEAVKPDLIFDKTPGKKDYELFDWKARVSRKIKFFNHPLFRIFFDNKLSQYINFGDNMAKSFLATDKASLPAVLQKLKGSKAVVKPLYGSGGFGILIDQKAKILQSKLEYPVLVQEFVPSHGGIPGFTKEKAVADLRMIFVNHKLIYALSRTAKKGSLFTNFHQGASAVLVPNKSIPKSAIKVAGEITKKLKTFSEATYSLDFIFSDAGKPILVEMNTTPGFDLLYLVGDKKLRERFYKLISEIA